MRQFIDAGADVIVISGGHVVRDGLGMLRGQRPLLDMAWAQPDIAKKIGVLLFGPWLIKKHAYSEGFFRRQTMSAAHAAGVPLSKVALIGGVQCQRTVLDALEIDGFGFVCLGRGLLRDLDFVNKVYLNNGKDVEPLTPSPQDNTRFILQDHARTRRRTMHPFPWSDHE